jgi:hypothetical protein
MANVMQIRLAPRKNARGAAIWIPVVVVKAEPIGANRQTIIIIFAIRINIALILLAAPGELAMLIAHVIMGMAGSNA